MPRARSVAASAVRSRLCSVVIAPSLGVDLPRGPGGARGATCCLLREDPLHQVADLGGVLGLHDRMLFLVPVLELRLLAGRDVLDQPRLGLGLALVLGRDVLEGGPFLLLVDRVAFEAVALAGELLRCGSV